jgi:gamma-glutamyltranspeptidase/glutathione hydrolase
MLRRIFLSHLLICSLCGPVGAQSPTVNAANAKGSNGAVAAARQTSVDAGMELLLRGGNAIDAAVATILTQTVVESRSVCLGGEVPIIVYDAKRNVIEVLSGMGAAPRLATSEWFRQNKAGKIPRDDPAGAAVPAVLHTCLTALDRYGTLRFGEVAQPMLRALDHDEPRWYGDLAKHLRRAIEAEQKAADRHGGIQSVIDYFYRGPAAQELDDWSKKNGGLIRYEDLAAHQTHIEAPVSIHYRGYTIYKCGPWTQGPFLLQALRLLEGFDLKAMGHNRPDYVHTVQEAMKLAFSDRDTYYGDPRLVEVPLSQLLSDDYTGMRRSLIDPKQASLLLRPGDPRHAKPLLGIEPAAYTQPAAAARDTTTCLVADKLGNVVSATPSGWSGVTAGSSGVVLGSRLISFNTWEGHPNCVAPGKRPRITLTPTLVCKDDKPVLAISVAGGDLQDQTTLQVLLNVVEFGMDPGKAVTAPRFSTNHHVGSFNQTKPELGSLSIYSSVGEGVIGELKSRGHVVRETTGVIGHPVAIAIDPQTSEKHTAGDAAAGRRVAAY